jgi:D-alanyl-D-alanine carboxypeptidase/D-alanyl-D-alanine-endopeptidase (penicillin-binding protein 4)
VAGRLLAPALALVAVLAALLGPATAARAQSASALRAQLVKALRAAPAASGAYARDLDTGEVLVSVRAAVGRIPASLEKLYTTSTAILRLGPGARLRTTVAGSGFLDPDGVWRGHLHLRGAGDPTLGPVSMRRLARSLASEGIVRVSGRVVGDESLFDAQRGGPRTGFAYDPDIGGVLGALTVSRGWSRAGGPAAAAARSLVDALRREGIVVRGGARVGGTPAGARTLASLASPRIRDLVRATLEPSDNFYAETLLKVIGARAGDGGTTPAGAAVVRDQLAGFGLRPRIADGSGLSRLNRTSPRQVVGLLDTMHDEEDAEAFESSLAIVGRSGTVARRMRGTRAQDRCRAKTGTLRDVSALAGVCTTAGGRTVGFAFIMNRTSAWRARAVQDRMAVALARFGG